MKDPFDELAKGLADGVSRREALRRLGGGLATTLLASVGLGRAWGQGRGCGSYCRARVRSPKAFTKCVISCQDCLQDEGTLCGASAGGAVTCCGAGLTCINGECHPGPIALICGDKVCPSVRSCCLAPSFGKDFGACCLPEEVCCAPLSAVCCPQGTTCCQGIGIGQAPTVCCREDETCCRGGTHLRCCPIGTRCGRGQCLPAQS
jgi:F0F1-type ATP synthase membrane subunit c/vacuolar-type H+-ATPase subunit K